MFTRNVGGIYQVTTKSVLHEGLLRDAHAYSKIPSHGELSLLIRPWRDATGQQKKGRLNQPLYTVVPYVKSILGNFIPLKDFFEIPLQISRVSIKNNDLLIPKNLIKDIAEDFATIIYNNYYLNEAEDILSQLCYNKESFEIHISGIDALKNTLLLAEASSEEYNVGDGVTDGIRVGDDTYALLIQGGTF
jgi:hypothetical protein